MSKGWQGYASCENLGLPAKTSCLSLYWLGLTNSLLPANITHNRKTNKQNSLQNYLQVSHQNKMVENSDRGSHVWGRNKYSCLLNFLSFGVTSISRIFLASLQLLTRFSQGRGGDFLVDEFGMSIETMAPFFLLWDVLAERSSPEKFWATAVESIYVLQWCLCQGGGD